MMISCSLTARTRSSMMTEGHGNRVRPVKDSIKPIISLLMRSRTQAMCQGILIRELAKRLKIK